MRYLSIKMALFKSMRETEAAASHRFLPLKNIVNTALLSTPQGSQYECRLVDLSRGGLQLALESPVDLSAQARFDFLFFVERVGFIGGSADLAWCRLTDTGQRIGLRIAEMSGPTIKRLDDTIKNFTHVNVEREAVW
jgi:hypothetical protein